MKKFISFILCISMLCGLCCVVQAKQEIDFGVTVTDTISENNTENKYSFDVTYSGKVSLDFTAENIEAVNLQLYDESGQEIWSDMPWWNSTSKQISFSKDLELTAGSYSLVVSERSGRGTYDIELNFDDSNESFSESQSDNNNSFKRASLIDLDENYTGQLAVNDEIDNYMFTLDSSGGFDFSYTAENIEAVNLKIYNEKGQEIWSDSPWWNSTSKQISFSKRVELISGTYYLSVSLYRGYGTYDFKLIFDEANESFIESQNNTDNSFKTANEIDVNETYTGQLAVNDEMDSYVFSLGDSGSVSLSCTAENIEAINVKIFDGKGQEIWGDSPWWNSTSKQISYQNDVTLSSGTYYFIVSVYSGYGTYEFDLSIDGNQNNNGDDYDDDSNLTEDDDDYYYDDDSFQENTIKVRTSDLSIFINGEKVYFPDARPFIDSADRTQVPVRFVTETMGYEVDWHDREKIVEIYTLGVLPSTKLYIKINENYITLYYDGDGNRIYMDTTSQIVDDRTYIPLRYVAEALGYNVEWE